MLFVLAIGLMILSLAGIVQFTFFPQAYDLYKINRSLFFWLSTGHLHAVRLMIAYPAVWISDMNSLELDAAFTIYSCIAFTLIGFFFLRILKQIKGLTAFNRGIGLLILMTLALIMNGRLIYAFLGIILILDAEWKYREDKKGIIQLKISEIIGLILTMVSSGTMTITAIFIVIVNIVQWIQSDGKRQRRELFVVNVILLYPFLDKFFPYFIRFLIKNIDYYGGGFNGAIGVMQHGFGKLFYSDNKSIYIIIVAVALVIVFMNMVLFIKYVIHKRHQYFFILLITNLCVYGGVFGFSTGLLALLPVIALILAVYFRQIKI